MGGYWGGVWGGVWGDVRTRPPHRKRPVHRHSRRFGEVWRCFSRKRKKEKEKRRKMKAMLLGDESCPFEG